MPTTKLYGKQRAMQRKAEAHTRERAKSPQKISILWAGGWDELVVDPLRIRSLTPEEIAYDELRVEAGHGSDPFCGDGSWLRGYFTLGKLGGVAVELHQAIKIVQKISSGD